MAWKSYSVAIMFMTSLSVLSSFQYIRTTLSLCAAQSALVAHLPCPEGGAEAAAGVTGAFRETTKSPCW